ncbi:hypothetical protein JCM19233_6968 [Vibrio astriarenae]|nr:hypothetical protein JCM19233_6968 [Vibrio sp. C7]
MDYQPPVYTHGMIYIPDVYNELDEVQARAKVHAERLIKAIREPKVEVSSGTGVA